MAYTSIIFKHPQSGEIREAPVGFSWTVLFFGFFPPLLRMDWIWALVLFVLWMMTVMLTNIVFAFLYNKIYIRGLIKEGFQAESIGDGDWETASIKIGMPIPRLGNNKQ